MKKSILIVWLISMICCFLSCKDKNGPCDSQWDQRLTLFNNTDSNCYIVHSSMYPDTSFKNTMYNYSESKERVNYAEKKSKSTIAELCWDDYFNNIKSDTLMIFVILDAGQGRENLKDHYTVLKRYDLTLKDLEKKNWTITYP
jgi:hypothetical protein